MSFTILTDDFEAVVLTILCSYLSAQGAVATRPPPFRDRDRNFWIMTTFDKREEGFEKKFAHDEELKFKAEARRNRLLGLWAATKLGMSGEASNAYAKEIVSAAFGEGRDADVVRKVIADLGAKGITITETQIRTQMDDLMAQAVAQVKAGA